MILAALLLQASALDAERAFDAMAAVKGQWTAFRAYAGADDAMMFVPQPADAQAWLKDRADPPKSVRWQPIASYVSCDGAVTVNTGAWQRPDGTTGYFTTLWQRQPDGTWRWMLDHGDALPRPRAVPANPVVRTAACTGTQPVAAPVVVPPASEGRVGWDGSRDGSLRLNWRTTSDGSRRVTVDVWNGTTFDRVIDDHVAASPK